MVDELTLPHSVLKILQATALFSIVSGEQAYYRILEAQLVPFSFLAKLSINIKNLAVTPFILFGIVTFTEGLWCICNGASDLQGARQNCCAHQKSQLA